jgi:hypothetical protein
MRHVTTARLCEITLASENHRVNTLEALFEILSTVCPVPGSSGVALQTRGRVSVFMTFVLLFDDSGIRASW